MQTNSKTPDKLTVMENGCAGPRIVRYSKSIVIIQVVVGVILSILLQVALRRSERAKLAAGFERAATERVSVLSDRLEEDLQSLDWLASFYGSSQKVERSEFREFTRQFLEKNEEISSLQWLPLVRDGDRAAFEALTRKDGLTDFQISEGFGQNRVRAPRRQDYFPVYFIEPYEGNEDWLGLDFASDPTVLETLKWSRDNDRLAATAPLLLRREASYKHDVLILRPVYDEPALMSSPDSRRDSLKGFVVAAMQTDCLLDHALGHFKPFGMDIYLYDLSAARGRCAPASHLSRTRTDSDRTLLRSRATENLSAGIRGMHVVDELQVADRKWTVLCLPAPALFARGKTPIPWIAMGAGLGFTGLSALLGVVVLQRITKSRQFTAQLLGSQQELRDEIAEHERTERALRESEKRFSLAVEGSSDGIWDWPDVGRDEQWWSPRWYELLEYEDRAIEASYPNFLRLLHPDDLDKTKKAIRTHFEEHEPVDTEYRLRTRSGEYRWFRGRAQAVWDDSRKCRRLSGSIQDITEQKRAEIRVLKERRFSENLINSSVDGILAYDDKYRCTIWNPGMERIAGVDREQALGKCIFDVFPSVNKADEDRFFHEALAGRTVVARDRPYIVSEGDKRGFFEGYYSPLRDASGKIIGGLAIIHDITARKQAEEEVQRSKSLYQNLVETSHDLIFQCNNKGEFVFLNKAWQGTTGYRIQEMIGQHFSKFKKPEAASEDDEAFSRLLKGESISDHETTYVTKSGEERYLLLDMVPRCDTSGRVIGIQGTAFDFTERKMAEQTLEDLNRELETTVERLIAANSELADFAHVAAHDLRTPLRGIGSLAGIISSEYHDKLDQHGRELLDMLVLRAGRMYEQIGSILCYSEIGRIEEKKRKVNLNKLIEAITIDMIPPENVEIVVAGALPTLTCNETRVSQVFQNLLDNAIKYLDKPHGLIRIGCEEEDHFWKFSVTDNGPGIEEKYFKKIFQLFQTLANRDEIESTGIGLSMARKIVEMSGGTIWVESEFGKGTTFFFTLPKQETGAKR